ncbi:MAG: metallophosphoesterase [Paramuribaculum sp.]|nr:metallophosphoesterase [Paramuribaculum sp.]
MRIPFLSLILLPTLAVGTDIYVYFALKRVISRRAARVLFVVFLVIEYALLSAGIALPARSGDTGMLLCKMWALFAFSTILIPKAVFCIIDAFGLIPRCWNGRRWRACSWVALIVAVATFVGMWWGALEGRYELTVKPITISNGDLPAGFDGYRIVQFSDFHLGTYGSDTTYVAKVVDAINSLEPDLIVFTGDLVNRTGDELRPFTSVLARLHAPDGVISIMGNHDYGDYYDWGTQEEKAASLSNFQNLQRDMGWNLLLNESQTIRHGGDSIIIVGVENVGDPPFSRYGDLGKAYPTVNDDVTKILLSHNPAHWEEAIEGSDANILLTLSGHTHAMQIQVGNWSPASLRYRHWAGLYDDGLNHYLNVDSGIGTVGFPMRLGATPQITLITLSR